MPQLSITIDERTGAVLVEHPERFGRPLREEIEHLLGPGQDLGCARPTGLLQLPPATPAERAGGPCLQTAGYYHDSLVEGPGRRSSVLLGGCDLACHGCWVPHLHPAEAGAPVPVERLADARLDPAYRRDGVSERALLPSTSVTSAPDPHAGS